MFLDKEATMAVLTQIRQTLPYIEVTSVIDSVMEYGDHGRAALFVLVGINLIMTTGETPGLGDTILDRTAPELRPAFEKFCELAYIQVYNPLLERPTAGCTTEQLVATLFALVHACMPLVG